MYTIKISFSQQRETGKKIDKVISEATGDTERSRNRNYLVR